MDETMESLQKAVYQVLQELNQAMPLTQEHLLVIGGSTSEIRGQKIGTSGTVEIAQHLFEGIRQFQNETGVKLAFQCCEHLNRALVVEREVALNKGLEVVSAIPVRSAGGALATYAYHHLHNPVLVEFISADAGIDIGDTFIGMHLKHVAVPVRPSLQKIGEAHVTMAKTRPKLIGGERAVYPIKDENQSCMT